MKCKYCSSEIEFVILKQIEEQFYKYFPDINQLEDFHGDGSVIASEYYCPVCGGVASPQRQK